jgi:CheY-like chemotaxis protein/CHASE3 domain sensor protein
MVGFVVAVVAVLASSYFSHEALDTREEAVRLVTHTRQVLEDLQTLQASVRDAETGQRGYLITGNENYLEPYLNARAALPLWLKSVRTLTADNNIQQRRLSLLDELVQTKLQELEQTIELRRSGKLDEALLVVRSDRGKLIMDRIRTLTADMRREEQQLLDSRQGEWERAVSTSTMVALGGSALLLLLIAAGAVVASNDFRQRETNTWMRNGIAGLSLQLQGDQRLEQLGQKVLDFLTKYLDAPAGAVYIAASDGNYHRFAAHAAPPGADDLVVRPGTGLLGQAAKENRALRVRDVPPGYLTVGSSLGRTDPRELLVSPASVDGVVRAIIELAFLRQVHPAELDLLERASEILAIAVRTAVDRSRLEELLEETQRQAEELQAQQEELRVNNEELEEQGRALKESQANLESQQVELEQTNSQLEEQAQQLETQRDELEDAQKILSEKAADLERSNQYKSEFLANMSHELRTPLNSTLILAKLLADNKGGNLTEEQVKFASTISSAGNDLLVLINDILDLSKIEAGKVEVNPESLSLARVVEAQVKTFQQMAEQKGLRLTASIDGGLPNQIETDGQRLGQILKNLLSNALKFTEKGEVTLRVSTAPGGMLAFAVRDTGIGIQPHQHELVFEAFRQADGSTHRKYGGTGLGLSISRDLARLLGGDITIDSTPDQGSTFTLTLPAVYAGGAAPAAKAPAQATELRAPVPATPRAPAAPPVLPDTDDDRDRLSSSSRLILIVEDDHRFAVILRDLVREMDFQCIVTHSANDGLVAARQYRPSGIVLDVNLPDHSGLGVLDQLKRNSQTRHIPVHVVSVADYTHQAMELGAVGYDLKPVKRVQLVEALERLEAKFSQDMRRVLVVEDDERQRESIRHLLTNDKVEITTVDSAAGALAALGQTSYDCMILDLNLPDLSGYELLEKMAAQDDGGFPPVIVYTGRSLAPDEEQQLRRFSKSIIIKDARSPERLLDEVTLFLHQVEATLPAEIQTMLQAARDRDRTLDGRRILVVEDDARNVFALSSILEPQGAKIELARNGRQALEALDRSKGQADRRIDLVLMDIMMPEMDGFTAMREIRRQAEWKKLPIIALTAKAMRDDQDKCLAAGANDYIAKPLDVEKLLSLVRVWMPK